MSTTFTKTSEVTSVESTHEATVGDVKYVMNVRKVNNAVESVSCTISKGDAYVGNMYRQSGNKNISVVEGENASVHGTVFEEFLKTIGD